MAVLLQGKLSLNFFPTTSILSVTRVALGARPIKNDYIRSSLIVKLLEVEEVSGPISACKNRQMVRKLLT